MRRVGRLAAKYGAADDACKRAARVGSDRMPVVDVARIDDEGLVRSEQAEVCVVAHRYSSLPAQACELRGPRRHPAGDVAEAEAAAARAGPDQRQSELERGDAAPRGAEVAAGYLLHGRRGGRVVRDDEVDNPVPEAAPEQLAIGFLPDRRRELECRRAVG